MVPSKELQVRVMTVLNNIGIYKDELREPITRIVERLIGLGITDDSTNEQIRSAVEKCLSFIVVGSDTVTETHKDLSKLNEVLKKILKQ